MIALLRAPGNNPTPRAVVHTAPGIIALDTTCVTPSIRWYTVEALAAVNGREAVAAACKTPERTEHVIPDHDMPWEAYEPRKPLVVTMPADMMANIRQAMYCQIRIAA